MTDKEKAAPRQECSPKKTRSKYSSRSRVGGGFTVRFRWTGGSVECQWSPRMPKPKEYRKKVSVSEYQAALMRFIAGGDV